MDTAVLRVVDALVLRVEVPVLRVVDALVLRVVEADWLREGLVVVLALRVDEPLVLRVALTDCPLRELVAADAAPPETLCAREEADCERTDVDPCARLAAVFELPNVRLLVEASRTDSERLAPATA